MYFGKSWALGHRRCDELERSSILMSGRATIAAEVALFPARMALSVALRRARGRVITGAGSGSYCDLFAVSAFEPQHFSVFGHYLFVAVDLFVIASFDVIQHGAGSRCSQVL